MPGTSNTFKYSIDGFDVTLFGMDADGNIKNDPDTGKPEIVSSDIAYVTLNVDQEIEKAGIFIPNFVKYGYEKPEDDDSGITYDETMLTFSNPVDVAIPAHYGNQRLLMSFLDLDTLFTM